VYKLLGQFLDSQARKYVIGNVSNVRIYLVTTHEFHAHVQMLMSNV